MSDICKICGGIKRQNVPLVFFILLCFFFLGWGGIVALTRHARQNIFLKLFDLSKESSWEKEQRSPLERRDTQWKVSGPAQPSVIQPRHPSGAVTFVIGGLAS